MSSGRIPLSRIGPVQVKDVEHSGSEVHDGIARTCTVLQGDPPSSSIGDDVPCRIAGLYGHTWNHWNRHLVMQVAACPLKCWYCYVDNFRVDLELTPYAIVRRFELFRSLHDINVLHLMGGCPGRYAVMWPEIRYEMDKAGHGDAVLLTDVILVENTVYGASPWLCIPHRTVVSVCLKGTNWQNFKKNTGTELFGSAMYELRRYMNMHSPQIYYSLIEWDEADRPFIENYLGSKNINWLKVKEYEVVKARQRGEL